MTGRLVARARRAGGQAKAAPAQEAPGLGGAGAAAMDGAAEKPAASSIEGAAFAVLIGGDDGRFTRDQVVEAIAQGVAGDRGLRRRLSPGTTRLAIAISGAVAIAFVLGALPGLWRVLVVRELLAADQDALRVMCAVEPPSEFEVGRMHICEQAAVLGKVERPAE